MYPPEFLAWRNMVYRCTDPYHRCYPKYGGAGVRVHEPWLEYTAFRRDMGSRPDGYVLARRDRNGDFTPDNCYWESRSRTRRLVLHCGVLTNSREACDCQRIFPDEHATAQLAVCRDHPHRAGASVGYLC
jgi:hypothetical protein